MYALPCTIGIPVVLDSTASWFFLHAVAVVPRVASSCDTSQFSRNLLIRTKGATNA